MSSKALWKNFSSVFFTRGKPCPVPTSFFEQQQQRPDRTERTPSFSTARSSSSLSRLSFSPEGRFQEPPLSLSKKTCCWAWIGIHQSMSRNGENDFPPLFSVSKYTPKTSAFGRIPHPRSGPAVSEGGGEVRPDWMGEWAWGGHWAEGKRRKRRRKRTKEAEGVVPGCLAKLQKPRRRRNGEKQGGKRRMRKVFSFLFANSFRICAAYDKKGTHTQYIARPAIFGRAKKVFFRRFRYFVADFFDELFYRTKAIK